MRGCLQQEAASMELRVSGKGQKDLTGFFSSSVVLKARVWGTPSITLKGLAWLLL